MDSVGFVAFTRLNMAGAALVPLLALSCSLDAEPSDPCGSLELGGDHLRDTDLTAPTVLALSSGTAIILLRTCVGFGTCETELLQQTIEVGQTPDQVMVSGSGRWLTYRIGSSLSRIDLNTAELRAKTDLHDVDQVLGSLPGSDWLIYRTTQDGELWAYFAGDADALIDEHGDPLARPRFRIDGGLDLRVAAMGHRHVAARRLLGDNREELYLIRVAPARRHDENGTSDRGVPRLLTRGGQISRVIITEGPSPLDFGDPYEFGHTLATDVQVIATSGVTFDHHSGKVPKRNYEHARTLIYRVSDMSQLANFDGAVVTATNDLERVAGLNAISPDGSHLAYRTPGGSLALRDLDNLRACMVRPASSGAEHLVAGFGADGTLYFESLEGPTEQLVYAYDPANVAVTRLTGPEGVWRLKAAPSEPFVDDQNIAHPWAVVAQSGVFGAADGRTQPLRYHGVNFLPRDEDESLWLLENEPGALATDMSHLWVRRLQPTMGTSGTSGMSFDTEGADPSVLELAATQPGDDPAPLDGEQIPQGQLKARFEHAYSGSYWLCVSASAAISQIPAWVNPCSTPDTPNVAFGSTPE